MPQSSMMVSNPTMRFISVWDTAAFATRHCWHKSAFRAMAYQGIGLVVRDDARCEVCCCRSEPVFVSASPWACDGNPNAEQAQLKTTAPHAVMNASPVQYPFWQSLKLTMPVERQSIFDLPRVNGSASAPSKQKPRSALPHCSVRVVRAARSCTVLPRRACATARRLWCG